MPLTVRDYRLDILKTAQTDFERTLRDGLADGVPWEIVWERFHAVMRALIDILDVAPAGDLADRLERLQVNWSASLSAAEYAALAEAIAFCRTVRKG